MTYTEAQVAKDLETVLTTIGTVKVMTVFWREGERVRVRLFEVEGALRSARAAMKLSRKKGTLAVASELDIPAIIDLDPPQSLRGHG